MPLSLVARRGGGRGLGNLAARGTCVPCAGTRYQALLACPMVHLFPCGAVSRWTTLASAHSLSRESWHHWPMTTGKLYVTHRQLIRCLFQTRISAARLFIQFPPFFDRSDCIFSNEGRGRHSNSFPFCSYTYIHLSDRLVRLNVSPDSGLGLFAHTGALPLWHMLMLDRELRFFTSTWARLVFSLETLPGNCKSADATL